MRTPSCRKLVEVVVAGVLSVNGCNSQGDPVVATPSRALDPGDLPGTCGSSGVPAIAPDQEDYAPPVDVHLLATGLSCGASYSVRLHPPEQLWPVHIPASEPFELPAQTADDQGATTFTYFLGQEVAGNWRAELLDASGNIVTETDFHDSHFRYSHLTWTQQGALASRTAVFTLTAGFRRSAFACTPGAPGCGPDGFVITGGVFTEQSGNITMPPLNFGDGSATPALGFVVTAYDVANDWVLGAALAPGSTTQRTIPHTYSGSGPFTAFILSGARLTTIVNASGTSSNYRNETIVRFDVADSSPVSSLPPIVTAPTNAPGFHFTVPRADGDGDGTTCRLATCQEEFGAPSCLLPPGVTVDPTTCVVSWSTVGRPVGELWTMQVMIEGRRNGSLIDKVGVDFILQVVAADANPPVCTLVPGTTSYVVPVGGVVDFSIRGTDADAGDNVRINSGNLPSGATVTPALPLTGPSPQLSAFHWVPALADAGTSRVTSFTVTDQVGQQAQCAVTIEVKNPVVVTVPGDIAVCPTNPNGAGVSFVASAVDGDGNALTPVCTPPSGAQFPIGTTTVSCEATDAGGSTGTASFRVTVLDDTTPPTIECPESALLECLADTSPASTGTATAADNCSVSVSFVDASEPQCGATVSVTRTWAATDGRGNTASCVQAVATRDTTPPAITCPAPLRLECTSFAGATATFGAIAADACGGVTPASCPESGGVFPIGLSTASCSAIDACGNTSACSTMLEVQDTTPPSIACPPDLTVECNARQAADGVSAGAAIASDVCGLVSVDEPGATSYPLGPTSVTHSATDQAGLTATCTNTVTVVDTTPPVFDPGSLSPRTVLGNCSGASVAFVPPTATDRCQVAVVTCGALPGNHAGANTVLCTATDASGNTATASIIVNVLAPLQVVFLPPLEDDNLADDINSDSDVVNLFQVKSTIPHQVKLLSCAGADVTDSAPVTVRLDVTLQTGTGAAGSVVVPGFNGVGDAGGQMVRVDSKYKYNLATAGYQPGTVNLPSFYDSVVSVSYASGPTIVVGREDARLESR